MITSTCQNNTAIYMINGQKGICGNKEFWPDHLSEPVVVSSPVQNPSNLLHVEMNSEVYTVNLFPDQIFKNTH